MPIFLMAMQRGQHYVPRGYSSFLGRAAGNQPHFQIVLSHIYGCVCVCVYCCSYLAFCFGSSFTREEIVVLLLSNKLSLLVSFHLEKEEERKKERTITDPVFLYWIISKTIKNIPLICFIESFCFPMSVSLSDLFP